MAYLPTVELLMLWEKRDLKVFHSDELGVVLLVFLDKMFDLTHFEFPIGEDEDEPWTLRPLLLRHIATSHAARQIAGRFHFGMPCRSARQQRAAFHLGNREAV